MQIAARLAHAAPPGVKMERIEASAAPPDVPQDSVEAPSRLGKIARVGLLAAGLTTAATGVLGYAVFHQPNPLNACQSPEVVAEQQLDQTKYELELDQHGGALSMCVNAPGKANDYSVTYQDGSYRVQTPTHYADFAAPQTESHENYAVPNDTDNELVGADESARWQVADAQERALGQAWQQNTSATGGLTVEHGVLTFPNSDGTSEPLLATRLTVEGEHFYTLNDSHGRGLAIFSETPWSDAQAQDALARVADYASTIPDHLATGATTIDFKAGGKPGADWAAATYYDQDHVVFWNGTDNLSERVLVHELGHEIGFDAARAAGGPLEKVKSWLDAGAGVPKGWESAMKTDGHALSQYSHNSKREDFAESWLGYLDAREQHELDQFRQEYPARTAVLEALYSATS